MAKRKTICRQLQFGHSAFFKKKPDAQKCAKKQESKAKVRRTTHTIRGKGWLVEV